MGQPNVGARIKRAADLKGDVDHTAALAFLRGLLTVLRQTGRPGMMLVLDEVETIQRVRADSRERSLNALRQLIDDVYGGRFPGLYILITGTPAFFDGPQGVQRLRPLAQRLHVDWGDDPRFDNPRDVQMRLRPFDIDKLVEVGRKVRGLFPTDHPKRIAAKVDDNVLRGLAEGVAGKLGGKTGIAPRIYLRKLVAGVLDKVDQFDNFEPTRDYRLVVKPEELSVEERAVLSPDDFDLNL